MIINANTKIAAIIKQQPDALDAIISLNPKFEKLRNPILRKLMAGRTSLATASKLGGITVSDFYNKLKPLGFTIDQLTEAEPEESKPLPTFISNLRKEDVIAFDVRSILASGTDPLHLIMDKIKQVQPGQALKIINTFEPTPLILLLGKKGFETYSDVISTDVIETYFYNASDNIITDDKINNTATDWDAMIQKFAGHLLTIDVRHLAMPLPMTTILEALDTLPGNKALFVYHKRIPVFLLPELSDRNFNYRIKEISDGEVQLLIYR